jgi:hypothetical protein
VKKKKKRLGIRKSQITKGEEEEEEEEDRDSGNSR